MSYKFAKFNLKGCNFWDISASSPMNVDRDFVGSASYILHAIFYVFLFLDLDIFLRNVDWFLQGNSRRDIPEYRTLRNRYEVYIK
jgi:hypothetical protein